MNLETKYGVVMLKENIEKISAINKTFGRNQSLYVIEECSELIKELIKEWWDEKQAQNAEPAEPYSLGAFF